MDEMSPPNYDEMLGKEENFRFPLFNQEWQPSENNNLHPDCAAIIVIKTCLPNFVDFATLQFDWFLHYEVRDDGKIYNLQNFAGKIAVESSIFYDEKFLATFSKDNVYKDLLTVTSTSKCIFVKLKFNDIATKECFYDFLANFEFAKIIGNCEGNADEKFDFLSTSHLEQGSTNIYFLSNGNSYWTGTLIRTKSHGFVDELKIYNKIEDRILSFIQSIRTRFAENIAIEFADNKCEEIKLIELKHAFQRELNFINDNVNSSNEHFKNLKMKYEYETDSALVNLNKASK